MRIWKVAACTLAAIASGDLGHGACATLINTATSAPINLEPPAETLASQPFTVSATPPQTDPTAQSQYLLGTEARHLSGSLTGELTNSRGTQEQGNTGAEETLKLPLKTPQFAQETMILPSETATQYVVEYKPPQNTAPQTAQLEDLRQRFRLPSISSKKLRAVRGVVSVPGSSVTSPTAFGADFGDVFVGASYQARARFTNIDDGGAVFGFGLGERRIVGLEVAVSSFSTVREGFFTNGGVSLKLHHLFPNDLAIAVGVENAATFGSPDGGSSVYGVASKVFELRNDVTKPFSTVTVSLGLGGGRFRSEHDVQKGIDSVNVFGSVGLRVAGPISLIADWTGQDLTIGTSIAPFRNVPFVITPAVADVTGNAGDGARFILGFGFGYFF